MTTQNYFPTMLVAVQRVLDEAGIASPTSSVATATRNSRTAVNALNDALEDIYVRTNWPWLRELHNEPLKVGVSEYALPIGFRKLDGYLRIGSTIFTEKTPYEFERDIPRTPTLETPAGIYGVFCIDNHTIRFGHTPTADNVAANPNFTFTYEKGVPPRVTSDSQCLDLPPEFYRAVTLYARSKVKQLLEYPDYATDMQEYEQALHTLLAARRQGFRQPVIKGPFNMGRGR